MEFTMVLYGRCLELSIQYGVASFASRGGLSWTLALLLLVGPRMDALE